jgi:putative endonuclease
MFDKLLPSKREIGDIHEAYALEIIKTAGLDIIEQNYLCKLGEVDIIARDGQDLVFVEVRFRRSQSHGGALDSVDRKKQRRIVRAANHYLQKQNLTNKVACRFDVFAITGNLKQLTYQWVEAAFDVS